MRPGGVVVLAVAVVVVVFIGVLLVTGSAPADALERTYRLCEDTPGAGFAATDDLGTLAGSEQFPATYRVLASSLDAHRLDYTLFTVTDDADGDGDGERDAGETGGVLRPSSAGAGGALSATQSYAFLVQGTGSDGRTAYYSVTMQPCVGAHLLPDPAGVYWVQGAAQTLWLRTDRAVVTLSAATEDAALVRVRRPQGDTVSTWEREDACPSGVRISRLTATVDLDAGNAELVVTLAGRDTAIANANVRVERRGAGTTTTTSATLQPGDTRLTLGTLQGIADDGAVYDVTVRTGGSGVAFTERQIAVDMGTGTATTYEGAEAVDLSDGMGVDVIPCTTAGGELTLEDDAATLTTYRIAVVVPTPTPTPTPTPLPSLRIVGGEVVTEGGTAVFTLTSDPAPPVPLPVTLSVIGRGGYVTDAMVTVSVPESGTYTHFIATTDDMVDEVNGSVTVAIATPAPTPAYRIRTGTAVVDVLDDDAPVPTPTPVPVVPPVVSISVSPASLADSGTVTWTVSASPAPEDSVTVRLRQTATMPDATSERTIVIGSSGSNTIAFGASSGQPQHCSITYTVLEAEDDSYTVSATESAATVDLSYGTCSGG